MKYGCIGQMDDIDLSEPSRSQIERFGAIPSISSGLDIFIPQRPPAEPSSERVNDNDNHSGDLPHSANMKGPGSVRDPEELWREAVNANCRGDLPRSRNMKGPGPVRNSARSCREAANDNYFGDLPPSENRRRHGYGPMDDKFWRRSGRQRDERGPRPKVIRQVPNQEEVDGNRTDNEECTSGQDHSLERIKTLNWTCFPPPGAPYLTEEMIRTNQAVLIGDENHFVERGPHKLYRRDMVKLLPGVWIEDQIIGFYLELIKTRNREQGLPSIVTLPSTFYALLASEDGFEKVKDAADQDNIFKHDILFIPVCTGAHWRLIIVFIKAQKICSFNSLSFSSSDLDIRKNILRFVQDEERRLGRAPGEWKLVEEGVPQQMNVNDCGIFLLQFANYVARGRKIDFSQRNMGYFRQLILYECAMEHLVLV